MAINPIIIEDINDFLDYKIKSRAEFVVAMTHIEYAIDECLSKRKFLEAFKLARLHAKFSKLYSKKISDDEKEELRNLRQKH